MSYKGGVQMVSPIGAGLGVSPSAVPHLKAGAWEESNLSLRAQRVNPVIT